MVERTLGKGEAESSILSSSTIAHERHRLNARAAQANAAAMDAADEPPLTPLDPRYRKALRLIGLLASLPLLALAIGLEIARVAWPGVFLVPALIVAALLVFRLPARRYGARGYTLGTDRLRTVRGVLFRSDTVVPFGRVQHIDVDQGPIERAHGIATLSLHTAGNHNNSVRQPGLSHEDALAMRETIRSAIGRNTM